MKTHLNSTFSAKSQLATIGSLILSSAAAFATDDILKFRAADVDSSGSLSLAEFRTTLSDSAREEQVLKKFSRADANDDKSVTEAEWIAFKNDDEDENDIQEDTARFNVADANDDGFLSFDEFSTTRKKKSFIDIRKRFLKADTDFDSQISLSEWLAYKNDDAPEAGSGKFRKFDLADIDDNDELTFEEFKNIFPRKIKFKALLKKFKKEDFNGDMILTREEWNPSNKR
jgi:Ca2+-binding EF-hand superfamily protein